MTTVEKITSAEEIDLFGDATHHEHAHRDSNLVVDTKVKAAEVQHVPYSASTALTGKTVESAKTQTVETHVTVKQSSVDIHRELVDLHSKVDKILGHSRSLSPTHVHKYTLHTTYEPVEKVKKYGYADVPFTTSVYKADIHKTDVHINKDVKIGSVHSAALTAKAVARAKEYLLEVNKKKHTYDTTTTKKYTYDTAVSTAKHIYTKPVDVTTSTSLSSSRYNTSVITSTPAVHTTTTTRVVEIPRYAIVETHTGYREKTVTVEVPTYKTYTYYKPATVESVYTYQPPKERIVYTPTYTTTYKPVTSYSYTPVTYSTVSSPLYTSTYKSAAYSPVTSAYTSTYELLKSSSPVVERARSVERVKTSRVEVEECNYCGQEVHRRAEKETKSRNVEEDLSPKKIGKRREILDERKQRSEQASQVNQPGQR